MAELILRPNGEGASNEHKQLPDAGEHWEKVDEAVADDATTYVYGLDITGSEDFYTIPAHGLPPGTVINKITIHGRFYRGYNAVGFSSKVNWRMSWPGGAWLEATDRIYSVWYTDSFEHLVNPVTSLHWTLAELAGMQIGTILSYAYKPRVDREGRNSQLYIVVDYEAAIVAPTVTTDPATEIT